jgi:hypothetical protein
MRQPPAMEEVAKGAPLWTYLVGGALLLVGLVGCVLHAVRHFAALF